MSEVEHAREPARGELALPVRYFRDQSSFRRNDRLYRDIARKIRQQRCRNFDKLGGSTLKDGRVIREGAEIGKSQSSVTDSCFPFPSGNEAFRYRGSVCRKIEPPPSPSTARFLIPIWRAPQSGNNRRLIHQVTGSSPFRQANRVNALANGLIISKRALNALKLFIELSPRQPGRGCVADFSAAGSRNRAGDA